MILSRFDPRPIIATMIGGAMIFGARELGWSPLSALGVAGISLAIIVGAAKTTTA